MEVEIPSPLYEELREEAKKTGSTVEQVVERAFRNLLKERTGEKNADE